jgi:hypothetical protein
VTAPTPNGRRVLDAVVEAIARDGYPSIAAVAELSGLSDGVIPAHLFLLQTSGHLEAAEGGLRVTEPLRVIR